MSVGGITQTDAKPLSVAAASETSQEGSEHSFLPLLSYFLSPPVPPHLFALSLFSALKAVSHIYLTLKPPELALTLRSGTGQSWVEITVAACTVSTLGETWWLSAAINEVWGGRERATTSWCGKTWHVPYCSALVRPGSITHFWQVYYKQHLHLRKV